MILPTFEGGGTHVNLSGVLLAKHAPNKANAIKLIEWLAGEKAQQIYADANYEYPIRAGVALNPTIAGYGKLKADPLPIAKIAAQPQGGLDAGRQGRLRQLSAVRRTGDRLSSCHAPHARRDPPHRRR